MSVAMKINEELNGIELYFNTKPQQNILSELKSNGFRWSNFKKCWYTKQSEKAFQVANTLTGSEEVAAPEVAKENKQTKAKKVTMSLWESTQWTEIEVDSKQDIRDMAKEIRSHIRKRFPQCKFSVRVPYYKEINADIKASPYAKDSEYLKAIQAYVNNLIYAYRVCYDAGDAYSDIPASYNFYFSGLDVDYDYTQTEATEEVKKDMVDFDSKLEAAKQAEEDRKHREYLEWSRKYDAEQAELAKREEEEKKAVENIYNSIEISELDENNQYFITSAEFADLNKNCTLDKYKEEVLKGDYSLEDVRVTKEIHFNNAEALENFSNMLMNDFDFLTNTGGSFTEDNRINSMTDFYNMDEFERKTVKWFLKGVAIYFEGNLQFVVDAQGYSYARYVGLTDNVQIEKTVTPDQVVSGEELETLKLQAETLADISTQVIEELDIMATWEKESWNEYKKNMKEKLIRYEFKLTKSVIQQLDIEAIKTAMYKLLTEVDGIQDQFERAEIQQGDKVTLFYISDWGSIVTNRITFDSVENAKYAQYDNAVKLTFKPEKKRNLHYKYFYSTVLVYKGWHTLPTSVLHEQEETKGFLVTKSKYHSCDNRQYDEILNHFEQQEILPIVNTYKPML
ncbi:LPD29 domain-containing protein [Bacillus sp. AG4(2022)]|uniref:LPD29 domain-containing protein n=1 Tax=Bacillus sp. AG4(2022) TaxID=2962594 RepID=UPI0028821FAD|nr:LPD29 domain-containing protein [Bacillus sp. AG4(2022)]MDT0160320.1 LPD29 domain-containing protein [Bacillus sp. AG4(2022)]